LMTALAVIPIDYPMDDTSIVTVFFVFDE